MPMTTPFQSTSGPPLLPGLIAASGLNQANSADVANGADDAAGHRVREHAKRGANRDDLYPTRAGNGESEESVVGIGVVDLKDRQVAALCNRHDSRDVCGLADLELHRALGVNHVRVGERVL